MLLQWWLAFDKLTANGLAKKPLTLSLSKNDRIEPLKRNG
jgi:hypothetical protein